MHRAPEPRSCSETRPRKLGVAATMGRKKNKQNKSKSKSRNAAQERSQTRKVRRRRRNERENVGVKGAEGGDEVLKKMHGKDGEREDGARVNPSERGGEWQDIFGKLLLVFEVSVG